jgi:hypothetical protein
LGEGKKKERRRMRKEGRKTRINSDEKRKGRK